MSRRYSNLDDLIHDLDTTESLTDDPFGLAEFDEDDLNIMGSVNPENPRSRVVAKPAPRKRGRPKKKKT